MRRSLSIAIITAFLAFPGEAFPQAAKGPPKREGSDAGVPAPGSKISPAQPFTQRARDLLNAGKIQDALAETDKAIQIDPKWVPGYVWRGIAHNRLGQSSLAVSDNDSALKIDPRNFGALIGRGIAYRALGDLGRAMADFDAAGAINPSAPDPYTWRAVIYSDMGDKQRGLKEATTAVQLGPKSFAAFANLGQIYNSLQQYDKAAEAYEKSIQLFPYNPFNLGGRGIAYMNLGDSDRALADFNAALALNPNALGSMTNRARIYIEKGNYEPAIRDLKEVVRQQPKNVGALLQLAKGHELSGDFEAARADFNVVLTFFPSHGVAAAGLERLDTKIALANGNAKPNPNRSSVRTALVIGNSHYKAVDVLANPERDAKLVAEALKRLGFEKVQLVIDGTRDALATAFKTFAQTAANADWAVIYYAGHGIEFDSSNYLVPVDVKYQEDADIPKESVALDQVLNAVSGAGALRLVILDACRENPFAADIKQTEAATIGRGLARIEPESGTLVAFATKHGRTATDGSGENSPFAKALVGRMLTPGLEINQLFRLVHDEVYAATDKQQEPFTYGQLPARQFYFRTQ